MRIRTRLAVTLALLVIPFAITVSFWQVLAQREAFETQAAEMVRARMTLERDVCEESPETWPRVMYGHDRGPHRPRGPARARARREMRGMPDVTSFAYDASFVSANPAAPPFDAELREAMERGLDQASTAGPEGSRTRLVAARMPWDGGPCAYVLVVRRAPAGEAPLVRALAPALGISLAAVVMTAIVAGTIVRRLRRLTVAVEAAELDAPGKLELSGNDEITDLARAFERARARIGAQVSELEARDATLRRYVADTTHDVGTPLTVLTGHLAAMERAIEEGRPLDPSRVGDALEESHYLAALLRNLSVAAKLETGARGAELHDIDLGAIVERVAGRHRPYAETRGVAIEHAIPELPVIARADPTLVEQAISNVVHNAVRYNARGGHVAMVLERLAAARFRIVVIDDGPGLPPADLARITERGFRGDAARTRHPTGTGLGLAIVSDVAERHGWTLAIVAREEGGLSVTLEGALA